MTWAQCSQGSRESNMHWLISACCVSHDLCVARERWAFVPCNVVLRCIIL